MMSLIRLLLVAALVTVPGCQARAPEDGRPAADSMPSPAVPPAQRATPTAVAAEVTTASGLRYQDLVMGSGVEATKGRIVSVHYTGWLTDGTRFETSLERGTPIEFPLGTAGVMKGWNEGITGMKVGGKRQVIIPPGLGFRPGTRPLRIPADATLIYDLELVGMY